MLVWWGECCADVKPRLCSTPQDLEHLGWDSVRNAPAALLRPGPGPALGCGISPASLHQHGWPFHSTPPPPSSAGCVDTAQP